MISDLAYCWPTHNSAELELLLLKGSPRIGVEFKRRPGGEAKRAPSSHNSCTGFPGIELAPLGGRSAATGGPYISTFDPSSTTRLVGRLRKSAAADALRCMLANSFSRHMAMPAPSVGMTMSRDRK
jgi:hypothetical protein